MKPLLAAVVAAVLPAVAFGQLPQPRLDRLFPLGGAAGSTVVVEAIGKDLDDATGLHVDRPGFRAEPADKPNHFRLSIPADAVPGTVEVRVIGKYGITGSRLFAVSRGLTEVAEKEPNDTAETAQVVPLDCAVNGSSDGDGDDFFRFAARRGQRVVVDCQALRLDSTLRATLVLSDRSGRELARSRPYHQRTDPLLDVTLPADGDYLVQLHDMTYAGGLPYRLVLSTRPHIEDVFPQAAVAGETASITVLGRNLPGGKPYPGDRLLDQTLDALALRLPVPRRDSAGLHRFDYLVHPAAPAAKLRGWQVVLPGLEAALNPATLVHADAPVTVEREPNDTAAQAQPLTLPAVVCGRFDRPGDADWYRVELKAGETIQVDLLGERLDRPGDPFVFITDDKGNERAQLDDHGITFNALALYNRDPNGTFTAPAAGTYRLLVQERYRQGGPRHGYVLRLRAAEPDFYPVVFHETNPDPTCPVVRQGGSAHLEVCLNRRSFSGPVVVEAKGLPAGVTCPPIHVSPQTDTAVLVFSAAVDARVWAGPIRVMATGTAGERTLVRAACAVQRRWAIANVNTSRLCREVCLAVRPGAAYQLRLPEAATVSAGGSVPVIATVRRHGDFKGKVQLTGLGLPPGFSLPTTDVPEGKDTATVTLTVANNVPPGRYSVILRGDGQVPFSKDAKAPNRPNVRVADPSTPLLLTVQPAAKKTAARAANRAGGVAQGPS